MLAQLIKVIYRNCQGICVDHTVRKWVFFSVKILWICPICPLIHETYQKLLFQKKGSSTRWLKRFSIWLTPFLAQSLNRKYLRKKNPCTHSVISFRFRGGDEKKLSTLAQSYKAQKFTIVKKQSLCIAILDS